MGYGDWLHWTSVIRDLYIEINNHNNINDKIKCIENKIIKKKNNNYGVINYCLRNNNLKFKIYFINFRKNKQFTEIFLNNPYITPNKYYPNLIFFKIISQHYFINNRFIDYQHIIKTYSNNIYLQNIKLKPELFFSLNEIQKINNFIKNLLNKDFIFIEPINYKIGRSYPFYKFQNIVNKLCNKIQFVQISPKIFGIKNSRKLENVLYFEDIFTFRETVLFMKYSKLVLVNHGGLSIACGTINKKVIAIYNAMFNPKMTKLDIEDPIYISSNEHKECNKYHPDPNNIFYKENPLRCVECNNLYLKHDENIIIDKINNYLNK